jgi:NTE family protein
MGIRPRGRRKVNKPSRTGTARKTLALALGGGGARGLAHVAVLEALDDLGARPVAIAGSSIGAAIGAAYAAGLSGRAIRRHVIALAHGRGETIGRLLGARAATLSSLLAAPFGNPMLLDAEKLCAAFLPAAVPGLMRPIELEGRVLVDGAAVNPLPFEHLRGRADVILAVDTTVGPTAPRGVPDPWESLFATLQVMSHTIVAEKLKHGAPDILIRPDAGTFRLLDFFQASAILRAAEPLKAQVKERLAALMNA